MLKIYIRIHSTVLFIIKKREIDRYHREWEIGTSREKDKVQQFNE